MRGITAPPEVKFAMIQAAIAHDNNLLSISELCRLAKVSRSGYYRWLDAAPVRDMREEQDKADFMVVVDAYNVRGYAKGARSIYMTLLHRDIRMNLKKIRRLMGKYGLFCSIRKANPYRRMAKVMRTPTAGGQRQCEPFVILSDVTDLLTRAFQISHFVTCSLCHDATPDSVILAPCTTCNAKNAARETHFKQQIPKRYR